MTLLPRLTPDYHVLNEWWATDGASTSAQPPPPPSTPMPPAFTDIPSDTPSDTFLPPASTFQSLPPPSTPGPSSAIQGDNQDATDTFTSTFPITTITDPTTTFTSFTESVVLSSFPISSSFPSISSTSTILSSASSTISASAALSSSTPQTESRSESVCLGQGLDPSADGILAALVIPSVVGLIIWLLFAILRPRFRQIYALREWFVQQDLRPKPLGSSFFAFLFPHVPLVPDVPSDVSDAGRSASQDAKLFPSDEQLSQRALWVGFLIVLGWSILGLAGALPLYLVSTPCNADLPSPAVFGGGYSTLQDLSLLRLLRLFDAQDIDTRNLATAIRRRASDDDPQNARVRIIILTVLVLVLGLLPALWKLLREFNALVAYRKRWLQVKCEGMDLAWLSARKAPGFQGWGERRLKDYIIKIGLSSTTLGERQDRNGTRRRDRGTRRPEEQPLYSADEHASEVDIQSLFTVGDTHHLALLIDERDEILENLEIAETRYIASFPFGTSSLAPTSFVAPSSYYKLRGLHGINGGRLSDSGFHPSFSDSINSRVIGSRFLEVNRNSVAYGRLPLGSQVIVEKDERGSWLPHIPDPRLFGPNYAAGTYTDEYGEGWVDLERETPDQDFHSAYNGIPPQAGPSFMRRPPKPDVPAGRRETFPLRKERDSHADPDSRPPPHLRLQPSQPFVRPLDGVHFDDLTDVYDHITRWRSRLKVINAEINEAQNDGYGEIADGQRIKGWLLVGRGLRHVPGVELIEGRAKEDIRWDILQNERTWLDTAVLCAMVVIIIVLLATGLTAASGLALSFAPDFSHYISFLNGLMNAHPLAAGIATVLAPAVAVTVFLFAALYIVNWAVNIYGSVSISGSQVLVFRIAFFILAAVGTIWLVAVGGLLFAMQAFNENSGVTRSITNGTIYMSMLLLAIIFNVAIIFPGILLLQPLQLWRVRKAEKAAVTPRQRFRAVYPRSYDPSFAISACVLAIVFASTFSLIFPLIAPAVVVLIFLTLIAHRFLIGYVYGRTHSQTGGLLQLWLVKRFGTLLSFQPILLGLIFLSRHFWIEGGVLIGTGVFVILFVECYAAHKLRHPGRNSLSPITLNSLDQFAGTAERYLEDDAGTSNDSSARGTRNRRGSMASVLEMMSLTLAVMPPSSQYRGPVPLQTENLDDLTATERAARTHPDAPPHLPALSFADHAEEMAGILYAPELIAPPPIIWLPNDNAGVAKQEALDLQKYHDLQVTLDVRATEDVLPRPISPRHRSHR
ncbi:hypothetical protein BDQ17DRAFT_1345391 [Cyathus striatus]|nr:hypothetical protein BDQ17DRAFT_1345391 [Cyathus striatus]